MKTWNITITHAAVALVVIVAATTSAMVNAQALLHQPTDTSPPVPISSQLLAQLDDPFFRIVIVNAPGEQDVVRIAALVQPNTQSRQAFIVSEHISMPEKTGCSAGRRVVMSFSGTHSQTGIVLDNNIFFSFLLEPSGQVGDLEAIGWDQTHGTYNYYRHDLIGSSDGRKVWKLRNFSTDLTTTAPTQVARGCLRCHVNGAPIMKEFSFPWNNWHSFRFQARYLKRGSLLPAIEWPAASSALINRQLASAEQLEATVQSAIQRFIDSQINRHHTLNADGTLSVNDVRGLLDSLFHPTELNLASSPTISGLDRGPLTQPSTARIQIPDSFFVNVTMMRDISLPVFQGQSAVPKVFAAGDLSVSFSEYKALLNDAQSNVPCLPGQDTVFAWFGPEVSEFDRRMVARLQNQGFVDAEFVASVLAIDVENPMFSDSRAVLLRHVPDNIERVAPDRKAQILRDRVIASIDAIPAAKRTPSEQDFMGLLQSQDPRAELNRRVEDYRDRIQQDLDPADATRRRTTLRKLLETLRDNRNAFRSLPISRHLVESNSLLPTLN